MEKARYEKIIEEIAREHKQPYHVVDRIVHSLFKFAHDEIQSGRMRPIRFHYLGTFGVKPGRLKILTEKKEKRNRDEQQSGVHSDEGSVQGN